MIVSQKVIKKEETTPRWKDDKKMYFKEYYQRNKERMDKHQYEYVRKPKHCEICDVYIQVMHSHKKSKRHIRNSQNQNLEK